MLNFMDRCKSTWAIMPMWAKVADAVIVVAIMATVFFI